MGQPYVGEIRLFAGNFAPAGWAFCDGQILPIAENDVLFTLIGTTYGGDGQETFGLPDLRGRVPLHQASNHPVGQAAGVESVTLTMQQTPAHAHPLLASGDLASSASPASALPATAVVSAITPYGNDAPFTALAPQAVGPVGGSQPHENLQPFLCVSFIISLFGIFPSQT